MKYQFHPLAQMLPLMNEADNDELAVHMKEHGQLIPIVLFEGKILDGRNRYRACKKLGIEPRVSNYSKDQARDYVIGTNLYRAPLFSAGETTLSKYVNCPAGFAWHDE